MFPRRLLAPLALVVAASVWGVVWYPYRLLEVAGLSGSLSSLLTYLLALALILVLYPGRPLHRTENPRLMLLVALAAGWTNLAYVLAVIQGEIMRVLLLFYLAPLWTIILARLVLRERANAWGFLVIALSLAGAVIMLYEPSRGLPFPANVAEWLGLSAGVSFALINVLARHLKHVSTEARSAWIFAGVVVITSFAVAGEGDAPASVAGLGGDEWGLLLLIAVLLVLATLSVQYGLAHTPANRAIVILLVELAVAALFSWLWAGELMGVREWIGGGMIIAASLFSGRIGATDV